MQLVHRRDEFSREDVWELRLSPDETEQLNGDITVLRQFRKQDAGVSEAVACLQKATERIEMKNAQGVRVPVPACDP